ncbi:DUF6265 family protein [Pedobacter ginsengisoli]|uniref:DUF6265 family protein n=1 Tax=Pedobacter ginsengisoli TaxID=363852 RepID=UPI002550BB12|nr:DUF6265 family protein [Pedobacter ginsengisoli]
MKIQQLPLIITALVIMGFGNAACGQESAVQKFKKLEWLAGNWQRTNSKPGQSGYENWSKVSGTKLTGKGVTLKGKETVFVEQLELSIKGDDIFYTVVVTGEPKPIQFKLTAISKNAFVCENPEHDFPKKIAYTRNGNTAKAVVSGNGQTLNYEFTRQQQ